MISNAFDAVIVAFCTGFAARGIVTGRIRLRHHLIYRSEEPSRFWMSVGLFGVIGLGGLAALATKVL